MIQVEKSKFDKIFPLVQSQNELSVYATLGGIIPGEVYVDQLDNPTSALIKTSECNLVAGRADNEEFNHAISSHLDFFDGLTPDTEDWRRIIPSVHPNRFIREYTRRRYVLEPERFIQDPAALENGFVLEKVDPTHLETTSYPNAGAVLKWMLNYGSKDAFLNHGVGFYIRNNERIVSWSLSDCSYRDRIAIGVTTDRQFRRRGFGRKVVSPVIEESFKRGYQFIEWLCVDFNKGSRAVAEACGFQFSNSYVSFTSHPPCENVLDLTETEWCEWGDYYNRVSNDEPRLLYEQLYAYVRGNEVHKASETILSMLSESQDILSNDKKFEVLLKHIRYFQSLGLCSNFLSDEWSEFVQKNIMPLQKC